MSLYDYQQSLKLSLQHPPFYALIMAAMRDADTVNLYALRALFPQTWAELEARYHAPGGVLPSDLEPDETIIVVVDDG